MMVWKQAAFKYLNIETWLLFASLYQNIWLRACSRHTIWEELIYTELCCEKNVFDRQYSMQWVKFYKLFNRMTSVELFFLLLAAASSGAKKTIPEGHLKPLGFQSLPNMPVDEFTVR